METSEVLATVLSMHEEARRRRLFFQHTTDAALSGRTVTVDGRRVLSFASCSYLGLERHPALIAAVHDGKSADVEKARFGTTAIDTCAYVQARDHYQGAVLREIVAEVGVGRRPAPAPRASVSLDVAA